MRRKKCQTCHVRGMILQLKSTFIYEQTHNTLTRCISCISTLDFLQMGVETKRGCRRARKVNKRDCR